MSASKVIDPVFVIGTGRSGTTLMFDMLSAHPDLAWPSQHMIKADYDRYDLRQQFLCQLPLVGKVLTGWPLRHRPVSEPYALWQRFDSNFPRPARDLDAADVPAAAQTGMPQAVAEQLALMGKPRFLSKYTGWSRIGYVNAIFPDARFLHVIRDGRAVAHSLMQQSWWRGREGPQGWRWGPLTAEDQATWDESGQSLAILAGLQWKLLMSNITAQSPVLEARYYEVRYEDLIQRSSDILTEVLEWAELPSDPDYLRMVSCVPLHDANAAWRQNMPPEEQALFNRLIGPALSQFGYDPV